MIKKILRYLPIFSLICISLFQYSTYAQGDLMIMPKRLVFDGSQRSQEINLANTGTDSSTYSISIIQYKMTEEGNFEQIQEPEEGQRFATDFLRYYPRQVSLAPNEAQTVRIQLIRTGNLEEGEYRSHIYFRAVEKQTALGAEEEKDEEGNISINIKTVFGISIPVIIRKGESTTKVSLSDIGLSKEDEQLKLSLTLNRSGNMSVYGNISVMFTNASGEQKEIGVVKGLSVYTPNKKRNFSFMLQNTNDIILENGSLNITYKTEDGELLAEATKKI